MVNGKGEEQSSVLNSCNALIPLSIDHCLFSISFAVKVLLQKKPHRGLNMLFPIYHLPFTIYLTPEVLIG